MNVALFAIIAGILLALKQAALHLLDGNPGAAQRAVERVPESSRFARSAAFLRATTLLASGEADAAADILEDLEAVGPADETMLLARLEWLIGVG